MENREKIEYRIVYELRNQLLGKLEGDEIFSFIYKICYLRYLSSRTFSELKNKGINTIEEFISIYKSRLNEEIIEEIQHNVVNKMNDEFLDCSNFINCAYQVLNSFDRYRYSVKDISKIVFILNDCDDIVIKNIMLLDLFDKSRLKFQTPNQICKIINLVLDINKNDTVLDIGSSYGNYLVNVSNCCEYKSLSGIDINEEVSLICKLRLLVLVNKIDIEIKDILNTKIENKYDKVLCHFPWSYRIQKHQLDYINENTKDLKFDWNKITSSSIDWLFINILLSSIKDSGKAATIIPSGLLFKKPDEIYRKDLIDNGLIEAIIKIPVLTNYTWVEQSLIVFSNGNKKVKFIDLSKQVTQKLGDNILNMNKVFEILSSTNNEFVTVVDNQILKDNNYLLKVENYIGKKEIEYYNPHVLSEYIIDIFRGYQMTLKEQNELEAIDGNYEILMISDIENGMISKELKRIKVNENKYDRYLLKEKDIIISSKGTRIKIAVAENIEDRKIIANGNLIVIRLEQEKLNPYYLEAYLNSSDGQTILNQIQTGSVIISINPGNLIDIKISMLPIEKQQEVSNKYRAQKAQIELTKNRLLELEKEQESFFENIVKSDYMRG